MTNQNNAAQAAEPQTVLSFDERERILCQFMREPINHDREMAIAIESAVLSKLRAPVADGWQPIDTAPAGQRVLLGPRRAPVVGIVKHYEDPDSDKPAIVCNVVHYNDTVLVADYHCSEWAPLASAPVAGEAREHIEQRAVNRYRPVPDGKLSYKVVAGDGTRSLYTGTKDSCLRVAAKLTEAFLDGAFVASDAAPQASAEPAQPCSCPSGDGSLRHPCAVHQASEAVRDAGIAASEDVVLPPLPEALALQPGQLGHTDQTLDYFARAAVLADRQQRADRSQVARNECDCATCRPHSVEMRMILCSICGDKRCPHAADHRNACTATQPEQGERDA